MFLGEPQHSPYDWRFTFLGFPVRVTWLFWAVSAAFGYNRARGYHATFSMAEIPSNFAMLLLIWVFVTFVSILVHELGHALAFRFFGVDAEIVLYQMGGVAIPGAGLVWSRQGRRTRLTHFDSFIVSAAGPAIQILLAVLVALVAFGCGINVEMLSLFADWTGMQLPAPPPIGNAYVYCMVNFLVSASLWWAVLNLLPVFPLDGGQIARHIIGMVTGRDGLREACMLGMIAGALIAIWMYQTLHQPFAALFFASLAYSNFQTLQSSYGGSSW